MEQEGLIDITKEILSTQEIKNICEDVKKNRVQALTMREVKVTDKDYKALLKQVSTAERVRHLSLSLGVVSDHFRVQLLALCVQRNSSLTGLFIHGNSIHDAGIQALYPSLRCHPRIVSLDVGDCQIGDEGLGLLCTLLPPLEHRPGLRELILSSNAAITEKGWTRLGMTLTNGTNLRTLYVDFNELSDVSASCLLMGVVTSSTLENLDMECTGITEATGQLFLQLLDQTSNQTLKSVNLMDNAISVSTLDGIMMRFPDEIVSLEKDDNSLSDDEHSLATSEPPLHGDGFVDDASEAFDNVYKVHPDVTAGYGGEQHEERRDDSLSSIAVVDVDESDLPTPDRTLTPSECMKSATSDMTPVCEETVTIKGKELSLAEKIRSRQLSNASNQMNMTADVKASTVDTLRSNSASDIPLSTKHGTDRTDKHSNDGSVTVDSSQTGRRVSVSLVGDTHPESAVNFLIPETPSMVSLHKYQSGLKGQDDGNFEPINFSFGQRPCSAPLNVKQTNHDMVNKNKPLSAENTKSDTSKPTPAVRNTLFSSKNLQVVDTRRRLSCGSVLQTSANQSKRLAVGQGRQFQRAHSLQTAEHHHLSDTQDTPGSPEQDNIRRRLSSASIHPGSIQKQNSADSNSTLGDISLEEMS